MGHVYARKMHNHKGDNDVIEDGEVGVVAEDLTHALSSGRKISTFLICKKNKTVSPSK